MRVFDMFPLLVRYNISYTVAAFVIVATLLTIVIIQYSRAKLVNNLFKSFLISALVMFTLNVVTAKTNEFHETVPTWLNIGLNGLYFFSGAVVALLFLYYCTTVALSDLSHRTRTIIHAANFAPLGLFGVALIFNSFLGFFFFFGKDGYTPGPAYLATNVLSVAYILECVVFFLVKHRRFQVRQLIAMSLFIASFFISFFLQLFAFPSILLSDFGTAIGAVIVFITIETPDYVKLVATLNELNELKGSLEMQVEARTEELDQEKLSYETLTLETLSSLAHVIDAKDHYTIGHSFRVAAYARGIAKQLALSPMEQESIYFAGLIHDVGKIGISEAILTKPGKLTKEEFEAIQAHALLGGNILRGIKQFPVFEQVARNHHERFDGAGYPDKLSGESIPFPARIVAVADTFDAMTSDRSYRKALPVEEALAELRRCSGTQFDPTVVDAFLTLDSSLEGGALAHIEELSHDLDATPLRQR